MTFQINQRLQALADVFQQADLLLLTAVLVDPAQILVSIESLQMESFGHEAARGLGSALEATAVVDFRKFLFVFLGHADLINLRRERGILALDWRICV